jgi:ADP-ribosylglycohydrolase
MIGAICGDVIGSAYDWDNIKTKRFELFSKSTKFTDDSVLTVAVADCILNGNRLFYVINHAFISRRYLRVCAVLVTYDY